MKSNVEIGSLVRSVAGRDSEGYFLVLSIDGQFAKLVDGNVRKLDHVKTKKLKHVRTTGLMLEDLASRINSGAPITDAEVNRLIKLCVQESEVSNV